jgi:hypothetical protein
MNRQPQRALQIRAPPDDPQVDDAHKIASGARLGENAGRW